MTRRLLPFSGGDTGCPPVQVRLFGQFSVRDGDRVLNGFRGTKVQELLGYLLLHRARPHSREVLAALLWGDVPTAVSRKYLRQALWQLHATPGDGSTPCAGRLLVIESDWVRVNPTADVWVDVAEFEGACEAARGVPCESMDEHTYGALRSAVGLYRGDLLDGWYCEWCLAERDRLQGMYLGMLDTLMGYCAEHRRFDEGLSFGTLSLRHDRARERTHQHLMRLHALVGDRTGALRQYQRCTAALHEELGVESSEDTRRLCRQITAGQLDGLRADAAATEHPDVRGAAAPSDVLARLKHFQIRLADLQRLVHQDIERLERTLADLPRPVCEAGPPRPLEAASRGESQKRAAR